MATADPRTPALAVPSCALDAAGLRSQRDRYAKIGRSVLDVERAPGSLAVTLAPSVDRGLVEEALRIERECCPFFELGFDPADSTLRIAVGDEANAPAVDAIAQALGLGVSA